MAARTLAAFYELDVSALAAEVRAPTLVMHSRGDARVPFDEGRRLASLIPGARFALIEDAAHIPCVETPAEYAAIITRFLEETGHVR